MTYKAFVSSTFEDLREHRAYVIAALRKAGFSVDPMEDWTAASSEPKEFSQDRLQGCDLCILLVAFRRGHVPSGEQISITQLEYRAAQELAIDTLVFMLKEDAPWQRQFDELDKDPEVRRWRTELSEQRGVSFFGLLPESVEVGPALTRWLSESTSKTKPELPPTHTPPIGQTTSPTGPRINEFELPKCGPYLLGREQELSLLNSCWTDASVSLVTIVGPGGVGKTALLKEWLHMMSQRKWCGASHVFVWNPLMEGSSDSKGLEDLFFDSVLPWFGVNCDGNVNRREKGRLLADHIAQHRALLILESFESLQYPQGSNDGTRRSPGIESFFDRLVLLGNPGLCVVTSRITIAELTEYTRNDFSPERSVQLLELRNLDAHTGAELLYSLGVTRAGSSDIDAHDHELRTASEEVNGHPLSLNLLGRYLKQAQEGNVLRRDKLTRLAGGMFGADQSATMLVSAYEKWFAESIGPEQHGSVKLGILRLLGLYDRPVPLQSLRALLAKPEIRGLTDDLVEYGSEEWNIALDNLDECGLVWFTENREAIDTYRIVREFFEKRLKDQKDRAFEKGHERLYKHFTEAREEQPSDLAGLLPLYHAVAHACLAGKYVSAYEDVYLRRILRGDEFYSTRQLGAISSDLRAVGYFFDVKWQEVNNALPSNVQGWLYNEAGFSLRAMGRTQEALEPFENANEIFRNLKRWRDVAAVSSNLSQIMLAMGKLDDARAYAEESVRAARQTKDTHDIQRRNVLGAYVRHQRGEYKGSKDIFRAITTTISKHPRFLLRPYQSYLYWDYRLALSEVHAWRCFLRIEGNGTDSNGQEISNSLQHCNFIKDDAIELFKRQASDLLGEALQQLTLGRVELYLMIFDPQLVEDRSITQQAHEHLEGASRILRQSAQQDEIPRVLLPYAWSCMVRGDRDEATEVLDEALRIAKRGDMKLHLADTYLYKARLFGDQEALSKAEDLIRDCGYQRRLRELEDAQHAFYG